RHVIFLGQRLAGLLRRWSGRRLAAAAALGLAPPRIAHVRLAEAARRLLHARSQLRFGASHRSNVLLGLRALRPTRAPIELPGPDHVFLLRVDKTVDPVLPAAGHAAGALRQRELLLVRLYLEKEDVAPRLTRPRAAGDVARARVVRDEVARLD